MVMSIFTSINLGKIYSLHLLMKNSDKLGGTKSVKELIFKGADKDIENHWGMKPIQYLD